MKLKENGLQIPSNHTLYNDLRKMKEALQENGILFDYLKKTSYFSPLGSSMKGKIKNVNISVNGYEYILYDEQHKILLEEYKTFKAPFLRLYKNMPNVLLHLKPD